MYIAVTQLPLLDLAGTQPCSLLRAGHYCRSKEVVLMSSLLILLHLLSSLLLLLLLLLKLLLSRLLRLLLELQLLLQLHLMMIDGSRGHLLILGHCATPLSRGVVACPSTGDAARARGAFARAFLLCRVAEVASWRKRSMLVRGEEGARTYPSLCLVVYHIRLYVHHRPSRQHQDQVYRCFQD